MSKKKADSSPASDTAQYLAEYLSGWIDRRLNELAVMPVSTSAPAISSPAAAKLLTSFLSKVDRICPLPLRLELQSRWPSGSIYTIGDFRMALELCRERLRQGTEPKPPTPHEIEHVSLVEMAALVGRAKSTLVLYKSNWPRPAIPGGKGKTAYWDYAVMRPILEKTFKRSFPATFPTKYKKHKR